MKLTYMRHLYAYDMAGENGALAWMQTSRELIANGYGIIWC